MIENESDQAVFYGQIQPAPAFSDAVFLLAMGVPVQVRFPKAGSYTVQIWFFQETSADVLKMEQPLHVFEGEA